MTPTDYTGVFERYQMTRLQQRRLQDEERFAKLGIPADEWSDRYRRTNVFDRRVELAMWSAARLAMNDVKRQVQHPSVKVVSAPTGSGKTMASIAFAATMLREDPEFTCAFVVNEIRQAQETYEELTRLVDPVSGGAAVAEVIRTAEAFGEATRRTTSGTMASILQ